jgi:hypothetical protein
MGDDAEHPAIIKTMILPGDDTSGNPKRCHQPGCDLALLITYEMPLPLLKCMVAKPLRRFLIWLVGFDLDLF